MRGTQNAKPVGFGEFLESVHFCYGEQHTAFTYLKPLLSYTEIIFYRYTWMSICYPNINQNLSHFNRISQQSCSIKLFSLDTPQVFGVAWTKLLNKFKQKYVFNKVVQCLITWQAKSNIVLNMKGQTLILLKYLHLFGRNNDCVIVVVKIKKNCSQIGLNINAFFF